MGVVYGFVLVVDPPPLAAGRCSPDRAFYTCVYMTLTTKYNGCSFHSSQGLLICLLPFVLYAIVRL